MGMGRREKQRRQEQLWIAHTETSAENGDPGTAVREPLEAAECALISYLLLLGLLDT